MKASQRDHEIHMVETIINQLKTCLAIYRKEKLHDRFKVTLIDLQKCRAELTRLYSAKVEMETEKGETINDDLDSKRSGTIVS